MPPFTGAEKRISWFGSLPTWLVRTCTTMPPEIGINHRPRRLNSGLAGEEGAVARHCVSEEAIVWGFSTALLFK